MPQHLLDGLHVRPADTASEATVCRKSSRPLLLQTAAISSATNFGIGTVRLVWPFNEPTTTGGADHRRILGHAATQEINVAHSQLSQLTPEQPVNLTGADLSRAYLSDARLDGADLSGANLPAALSPSNGLYRVNWPDRTDWCHDTAETRARSIDRSPGHYVLKPNG
ncbi:pentapeptide repeat-containing protein [Nocardia sp. NPDC057272]|uniref:pentapeptide repeat-containing protein n=1 Tax=Nocardia sp. NPDC057272 TaxID=3346079 RepID=UPI00363AD74C